MADYEEKFGKFLNDGLEAERDQLREEIKELNREHDREMKFLYTIMILEAIVIVASWAKCIAG